MTAPTSDARRVQISQVARWRLARNLIAVYAEIARKAGLSSPPSTGLSADDRPEALDAVDKWFDSIDDALSATTFRSTLSAMTGTNVESALYTVAQHLMSRRRLDEESRSKIEFVLVQYFLVSSPPSFHSSTIGSREVAEVLQPLIGNATGQAPSAVPELEQIANGLRNCSSMRELYDIAMALEACKQSMGDQYYEPSALVHITHCQYLLRLAAQETARTSVAELVRQLEEVRARGVSVLDCRASGMSEREPVDGLILTWKGLGEVDLEYRIHEFAPALLSMEKVLGERSAPNPQMNQELASLRSLAEKLSAQLAAISQRVQRLEILVPSSGSSPTFEAPKWRPAPPPMPPAPTIPIAMRTAAISQAEPAPARTELKPATPSPQNGNSHS